MLELNRPKNHPSSLDKENPAPGRVFADSSPEDGPQNHGQDDRESGFGYRAAVLRWMDGLEEYGGAQGEAATSPQPLEGS